MPFNPDHALLVVADPWDRLRGCDVDRLIVDEAGKTNAPEMILAIKHHRPDLIPQAKKAWEYLNSK